MDNLKRYCAATISSLLIIFSTSPLLAQENIAPVDNDETVIIANESSPIVPLDKISNEFRDFLGDNSETVVYSLRNGDQIIIEETIINEDGSTSTVNTTIDPPTGHMGNGNVKIGLGLAREELSQWGISQPTGEELRAALVGGEITAPSGGAVQLDGVLTLRSEGMGWGEIAHTYGVKLGHVMSGMKAGKDYSAIPETLPNDSDFEGSSTKTTKKSAFKTRSGKIYGKGIISGLSDEAEAKDLAAMLKSGSLPVKPTITRIHYVLKETKKTGDKQSDE